MLMIYQPCLLTAEDPITQEEMAKKLKTTRQHLQQLRRDNKIPFIPVGKRILYQPSKVIKALEKQTA